MYNVPYREKIQIILILLGEENVTVEESTIGKRRDEKEN